MPTAAQKRSTPMRKVSAPASGATPRGAFDPAEYDTQIDAMLMELREKRKLEKEYKKQSSLSRGLPIQSRAAEFYQFRTQTLQTSSAYLQLSARRDEEGDRRDQQGEEYNASEYEESGLVTARGTRADRSRQQQQQQQVQQQTTRSRQSNNASGSNPGSLLFSSMLDRERAREAASMSQEQSRLRQVTPSQSLLFLHGLPLSATPNSRDPLEGGSVPRIMDQGGAGKQVRRPGELDGSADRSDIDGSSTVNVRTSRTPRGHVQTVPPTPKQPSREYVQGSENPEHVPYYRTHSRQVSEGRQSPMPSQNAETRQSTRGPLSLAEILLYSTGSLSPYASVAREDAESVGASHGASLSRNEGGAEPRSPFRPSTPPALHTTKSLLASGIQEWDRASRFHQIREEFMKSSKCTSPMYASRGRHGSAVEGRRKSPAGRRLSTSMNGTNAATTQSRSRVQTPMKNLDPSQQAAYTLFLEEKVLAMTEVAESSKAAAAQHGEECTVLKRRLREAKNENALLRRDVYWRLKVLQQCIDRCREDTGEDGRTDRSGSIINGSAMYNSSESGACGDVVVLETDGQAADDDPAEAEEQRKVPPLYMRGIFRLTAEEERLLAKVRTLHPPVRQRDARESSSFLLRKHTPRTASAVEAANDGTPKYEARGTAAKGGDAARLADVPKQEPHPPTTSNYACDGDQAPAEEEDDRREMVEEAELRNSILKYLASTPTNDSASDIRDETGDGYSARREPNDQHSSVVHSTTTPINSEAKETSSFTVGGGEVEATALFPAVDEDRVDTQILGYNYVTQSGVASVDADASKAPTAESEQ